MMVTILLIAIHRKTSITVTKVWDDNNDQDGIRPNAIQVQLYANGKVSGDVITLSAANNWIYTWTGLAEKANKKAITYTVEEVTAIDGYTSETTQTSANNFTITNTHTPETTELSGTKVWMIMTTKTVFVQRQLRLTS
uniref:Cna B-type domain-containing protein n=1 Tax=Streptococcus iniae TaxID=1346 RepID=UPI003F574C60